jgi:uncharacterized caspase-like protein
LRQFVACAATAAISATDSQPLAKEDASLGHGYFTFAVVEGLKGKAEDKDEHTIRVDDLGHYIVKEVRNRSKKAQEPEYSTGIGDIILVKR